MRPKKNGQISSMFAGAHEMRPKKRADFICPYDMEFLRLNLLLQ